MPWSTWGIKSVLYKLCIAAVDAIIVEINALEATWALILFNDPQRKLSAIAIAEYSEREMFCAVFGLSLLGRKGVIGIVTKNLILVFPWEKNACNCISFLWKSPVSFMVVDICKIVFAHNFRSLVLHSQSVPCSPIRSLQSGDLNGSRDRIWTTRASR